MIREEYVINPVGKRSRQRNRLSLRHMPPRKFDPIPWNLTFSDLHSRNTHLYTYDYDVNHVEARFSPMSLPKGPYRGSYLVRHSECLFMTWLRGYGIIGSRETAMLASGENFDPGAY